MTGMKHRHHHHGMSDSGSVQQEHLPYWRRVHHDWRAWVVVSLMILAMIVYVLTDNLSFRFRRRPQQPVSRPLVR